jgi:hypothetical protein
MGTYGAGTLFVGLVDFSPTSILRLAPVFEFPFSVWGFLGFVVFHCLLVCIGGVLGSVCWISSPLAHFSFLTAKKVETDANGVFLHGWSGFYKRFTCGWGIALGLDGHFSFFCVLAGLANL